MKTVFCAVGLTLMLATSALAQGVVRQVEVNGGSGNADYPVAVTGSDGSSYACKADFFSEDGLRKRLCLRDAVTNDAPVLLSGGLGAGIGVAALALGVIAMVAGGDDTSTTTTSTGGTP
ncbi:hypothetical protein [Pseudosulfitobacter koreensis]|uniref:Uncharacterized protein n=1 Tax=Pseudosulfitobacter koreensis TaxID=2968472 RepID=A0ABT1Z240_9RHOB|nr:hypothetical protein [Pseudosulfitobacter koreense]MCR8827208.1 hypothetical protein [Pseudosulfitobacter koreense]